MIIRIKSLQTLPDYCLRVEFDDGKTVIYDVKPDMDTLPGYEDLRHIYGLFNQAQLDTSRAFICWNDYIDLPSDIVYEYGKPV